MVCELLAKCNSLEELHLQNNQIENDAAQNLVTQIKRRKISYLDVDNNKISG